MSLDNLHECTSCKQHMAAHMWVQLYGSLAAAQLSGTPEFLAALNPGPAIVKIEMCIACKRFAPSLDYTDEERKELEKYSEKQKRALQRMNDFGKLFG